MTNAQIARTCDGSDSRKKPQKSQEKTEELSTREMQQAAGGYLSVELENTLISSFMAPNPTSTQPIGGGGRDILIGGLGRDRL